jgi:uncharacterized protein YndB with AHSA1/START domain
MTHREIWHEIHFQRPPREVFRALTDVDKLAGWWTTDVRGESVVGSTLEFWFYGRRAAEMAVTELKAGSLVRWHVGERSIRDWIGTDISFEIFRKDKKTVLHLRHSKWREDAAMFPECSMHWAIFLLSFKEFVETGRGRPHPHDMPVNI